ncbi:hypothetical protein P154DRAFT_608513 [Amniculicola lignicola CBS 123094]|uniref:Uncharacterized protein n=1 Tax=Amniculicola lignicola CBS 123094 TaxID=1392246 RepID=A0A6A5X2K0_9PLEO|nr:hypothetical protein P154DRAFT_608513 [Amniculicola lignicola CBS 123094]
MDSPPTNSNEQSSTKSSEGLPQGAEPISVSPTDTPESAQGPSQGAKPSFVKPTETPTSSDLVPDPDSKANTNASDDSKSNAKTNVFDDDDDESEDDSPTRYLDAMSLPYREQKSIPQPALRPSAGAEGHSPYGDRFGPCWSCGGKVSRLRCEECGQLNS